MMEVTIDIIEDITRCKKWGYNESMVVISANHKSIVVGTSSICLKELKRVCKELEAE